MNSPADDCVYFIARTRGPVSFKQCANSAEGVKAYHDKNGVCLHCEYTTKNTVPKTSVPKIPDPVGFGRDRSDLTGRPD